jgi:hypothetical protein
LARRQQSWLFTWPGQLYWRVPPWLVAARFRGRGISSLFLPDLLTRSGAGLDLWPQACGPGGNQLKTREDLLLVPTPGFDLSVGTQDRDDLPRSPPMSYLR